MHHSLKTGLSFGITSGIITTLGLIVGLHAGTHSRLAVIGGVLTIAIADAMSDALGIHISEESRDGHDHKSIWTATISTFISKFIFALTFIVPIITLELNTAIIVSIIWGLAIIILLSYYIARNQSSRPWPIIFEHLVITIAVIILTHFIGQFINSKFN